MQEDASMPAGLCAELEQSCRTFPLRIAIVDNSGSMGSSDGSRLVRKGSSYSKVRCTRWQELGDDVVAVSKLAEALGAGDAHLGRTDFHLLNPTRGFSALTIGGEFSLIPQLGVRGSDSAVRQAMSTSPTGTTPLTEALIQVISQIEPAAAALRQRGEQVAVIIATDGTPNNPQSFLHALQRLQQLPVWVVVRLCTDEDHIVSYWNDLDGALEAPLEVLDDVVGEAKEVVAHNPWLTYGPSLQLARMFGLSDKLYDALDEQPLIPSQCKLFVEKLLGCADLPEPELDREAFVAAVQRAAQGAPSTYDPISGKMKPWIDTKALGVHLRPSSGSGCAIM